MAAKEGAAALMARNKTMEMPKRDLEGSSRYKPPRCLGELGFLNKLRVGPLFESFCLQILQAMKTIQCLSRLRTLKVNPRALESLQQGLAEKPPVVAGYSTAYRPKAHRGGTVPGWGMCLDKATWAWL